MPSCRKCEYPIDETPVVIDGNTYHKGCASDAIMKQEAPFKKDIVEILQKLQAKNSKAFTFTFWTTAGVLAIIGVITFKFSILNLQGVWVFFSIVGGLLFSLFFSAIVSDCTSGPECETAANLYKTKFPNNTDERKIADRILATIETPSSANSLRKTLKLKSVEEVKVEKEESDARRRLEQAQKAFEVTPSFKCSASINVESIGQVLRCHSCNEQLKMPTHVACPKCASYSTRIVSPEEQVKRHSEGKTAGALMYGPAGLIAGAVLDGAKDAVLGNIQKAFKKTKLHCTACNYMWAIKVPKINQ